MARMSREDRLAALNDVEDYWHNWLVAKGINAYNEADADRNASWSDGEAEERPEGADVSAEKPTTDYGEHAHIVSASREDLLAFHAMLIARGIEFEGVTY